MHEWNESESGPAATTGFGKSQRTPLWRMQVAKKWAVMSWRLCSEAIGGFVRHKVTF